jgi:hypothetical protein
MKRALLICTLAALPFVLGGCPSSAYHGAVVAEHDFTTALDGFHTGELAEYQAGNISPAEHTVIDQKVTTVAKAAQALVTALQSGAANATALADVNTAITALQDLQASGVSPIKNQNSAKTLNLVLNTASAILQNVETLIQSGQLAPVGATK